MNFSAQRLQLVLFCLFLPLGTVGCNGLKSQYYHGVAVFAHQNGQFARAIEMYQKYLEIVPDDPDMNYSLGVAYLDSKDTDSAMDQVRKLDEIGAKDRKAELQKFLVHELYPDDEFVLK